ncbi:MAG: Ig-like domain-containing protein, partial [Xanthomonadaceae bacterium]|nr:Ig-like domain-containing protein [Xanthomonadaceae bacterium]
MLKPPTVVAAGHRKRSGTMSSRTPRTRNRTGARTLEAWSNPWAPLLALLLFMLGSARAEAQSWITTPQANGNVAEDGTIVLSPDLVVSGTPGSPPSLAVTSGNQTVIPNVNVVLGAWVEGPPGVFTRTTTISPAANRNSPRDNSNAAVNITFNLIGAADPIRLSAITVTEVNDAPVAVDDTIADVLEDAPTFSVPVADLIADDNAGPLESAYQTFSLTAVGGAVGGTVALNGANVEFTPAANFNGAAQFTYTITDNGQTNGAADPQQDTGLVTFNITAVNDPPSFTLAGNLTDNEDDGAITEAGYLSALSVGPADEAAQTATVSTSNDNAALFSVAPSIALPSGDLTYTLAANASGVATVTVTVTDNGGTANGGDDSTTQTFTITVAAVNDAPVAVDDTLSTTEDNAQTIDVVANDTDVEGNTLVVSAVTQGANGAVTFSGGSVTYTPSANFNGADTFDYTVSDGNGGTDIGTVTVTVTAVNDPPSFTLAGNLTDNEDDGAITEAGYLTALSVGPADEAAQTATVSTSNDNAALFSVAPSIALPSGDLTY